MEPFVHAYFNYQINQIFHYIYWITPKRVTSLRAHLCVIAPWRQHSSSKKCRAVGNTVRFDRLKFWTSDVPLQKRTRYRSIENCLCISKAALILDANQPKFDVIINFHLVANFAKGCLTFLRQNCWLRPVLNKWRERPLAKVASQKVGLRLV